MEEQIQALERAKEHWGRLRPRGKTEPGLGLTFKFIKIA
jgi:hypothetical protein